jgi:hypothetical protein
MASPSVASENNISDYERKRAENIERNNARLVALGLLSVQEQAASNALAWKKSAPEKAAFKKAAASLARTKKRKVPATKTPTPSSRKSLRLQGCQPDVGAAALDYDDDDHDDGDKQEETDDPKEDERLLRVQECRKVRLLRALEVSEAGADKAAKENPSATYEHCLMRVRTMTIKGLANRVKAIERAAGKHCVVKMAIFKSCLQDENSWELADLAGSALERLKALHPPPLDDE